MTVVAADGQDVHPVTVDEFRIATAETFDVLVTPSGADAFTIFAQSLDQNGLRARHASGARRARPRPCPSSTESCTSRRPTWATALRTRATQRGREPMRRPRRHTEHADTQHREYAASAPCNIPRANGNPRVDMQATSPEPRLADPGVGLRDNGRRVLTYADLRSLFPDPDGREPERTVELHLTGHMERFMWSFDGLPFAAAEPLLLRYGERLRIQLVNDTMMAHPIHLHGMWSDLEDEAGAYLVRKHTINMPPGTRRSYRVTADALGRWAYHCHLLFHMEAGMFREVRVDA